MNYQGKEQGLKQQHSDSFLWHDYETWGVNPAVNGPAQFAAIRTDLHFNPIGEPIMLYCKPPRDALPQPQACMITGISPQLAEQQGLIEAAFIADIHQAMMQPKTCSVGYNSIRFDDEVTRFALYRNFYDAYEREWRNGNSRWDLIDVVRLCAALRPEGINWPVNDEGLPSFRLEAITAANNIEHQGAHDALVDVRATIAVAQLIQEKQPKLFDYALSMKNKRTVSDLLAVGSKKPLFHVSGMFGNANHCASLVLPLCEHPTNKNAVVCFDLRYSPAIFLTLSAEEIQQRLFTKSDALAEEERIPLKNIHLNKSPMVAPVSMVDVATAQRIGMDLAQMELHYAQLSDALNSQHIANIQEAFSQARPFAEEQDVDTLLYGGGFFNDNDKRLMQQVRNSSAEQLAEQTFNFDDERLPEMLFRYRARNFPLSLNEKEQLRWRHHCFDRITQAGQKGLISAEQYQLQLEQLFEEHHMDEKKSQLLAYLMDWLDEVL